VFLREKGIVSGIIKNYFIRNIFLDVDYISKNGYRTLLPYIEL